jgi:hypothetical protein
MRHCLIICAALTAACTDRAPNLAQPYVPADLLLPCRTQLRAAETERDLAQNMLTRAADLDCANGKIAAIAQIIAPQ